jgi:hypothetical protein
MKEKMKIKPISGSLKSFKILNKRIETGVSSKNKSGKTFSLIQDFDATRISYQNLVSSIPAQPGILIITGHYKNSLKTLEILKSDESIRSTFSRPQNSNRFQTLLDYFKDQLYDHIEIQLAQVS